MKILLLFVCLVLGFSNTGFAAEPLREWKNQEGKSIRARMLSQTGDTVTLMLENGRTYILPVASLSADDQAYLGEKNLPPEKLPTDGWYEDAEAARTHAERSNLPVLMLFTGSDWCGYCIRLEDNVLSSSKFKSYAEENLVLVRLDFPRRKKQSDDVKAANEKLQSHYKVKGFPTVVLTDASGKEVARLGGYGGDSPEEYIKRLKSALK